MKKLFVMLAVALFSSSLLAATQPKQSIGINVHGPVTGNIMTDRNVLDLLPPTDRDTVYLDINSPGGNVLTGMMFIGAMERAKAKGYKFQCHVSGMAASMAFVIYTYCDVRTAGPYSVFLWHQASVRAGRVTTSEIEAMTRLMKKMEDRVNKHAIKVMGIDPDLYYRLYFGDALVWGFDLEDMTSNFLTVK